MSKLYMKFAADYMQKKHQPKNISLSNKSTQKLQGYIIEINSEFSIYKYFLQ